MPGKATGGGTGSSLTRGVIVVCGVASLVASLLSFLSIWLQTKNYRKPLLQRYVVRILLMVPIYSASSWGSLMSQDAAFYLDPLRDIYEAFTIYTFFQLLINFLGGERALIIMMHGRQPVHHPWPLGYCFAKVDISDPHTFLAIKRGILQYAWLKPVLSLATIIMKSTGIYQEGYIGLSSGYLWSGVLYNISVTLSLYSLAMFWVCMSQDLQPFRPVPKFLCIKLIIFASYWQGFFLSLLQLAGAIPSNVPGYTPDNLAAAIQDALICCEMPIFAIGHWYAFSWKDYADVTISAARMPVKFALRDAFGPIDLIQDTKETFGGKQYEYRKFDSGDNILAHEESESRTARMMEGMRYERGGKGKYWIPKPSEINSRTPLLAATSGPSRAASMVPHNGGRERQEDSWTDIDNETSLDAEDERLFSDAKSLEFGDWNYPVITAHVPSAERWLHSGPNLLTTSTNRNLLYPTKGNQKRRESDLQKEVDTATTRHGSKNKYAAPLMNDMIREESPSSSQSAKSGRSQLVDLMVEDKDAEEAERVRARKEGGAAWNENEARQFVRTYDDDEDRGRVVRQGFDPKQIDPNFSSNSAVEDDEEEQGGNDTRADGVSEERREWEEHGDRSRGKKAEGAPGQYGGGLDDREVWNAREGDSA